jgi:putative membrane protein
LAIEADGGWHRLHPLSPLVSAGPRLATILVVLLGVAVARQRHASSDLITDAVIVVLALAGGFIRWLVTKWQVADGVLRVDTGLFRRDSRRFPLSQVQAIDVVQSGIARVLGLAELRLRVAGGDGSRGGKLACLPRADAERLRAQLLAMAMTARAAASSHGPGGATVEAGPMVSATGAAAAEPSAAGPSPETTLGGVPAAMPERPLFRVHSGRLAGAVLLSHVGLIALVAIAILVTIGEVSGGAAAAAAFVPVGLGAVLGIWRQFNSEFATSVTIAPDGLRLKSGLVQVATETIRPGRIQAVRLVEPLVWRAFGWCRLEIDVAGRREHEENRAEGQRLRGLIPVGTKADANQMLSELLAGRPVPSLPAPAAARWKAPLKYHFLGWNGDERYVVASAGRVCRKTTWVPLEKVQSIRWVQGPVQRRFGLATVHLDVAGRRVRATIEDRTAAEADAILSRLPGLARAARLRHR